MFRRARVRLTALYILLFALVLGVFSIAFFVGISTILEPTFDVGPDLTNEQVAEAAYQATVDRVGLALLVADLLVVALVGAAAWVLASRTLQPIRDAHDRQRRFVADASHEMRTPLAAIRASAEAALAGPTSEDGLRSALTTVAASADQLAGLTNDLLLLARSEELPRDRRLQSVDLSVVVAETVQAFAAAHPGLQHVHLELAPDLPVSADTSEIGRIVANLVDNAFRYGGGPEQVAPHIVTRSLDGDAIVEVSDAGPGIASTDLGRVFEPFYRVNADAASPHGSGLGLAIAQSLARRNGGHLTVTSRPGSGTTFRLSLGRVNVR